MTDDTAPGGGAAVVDEGVAEPVDDDDADGGGTDGQSLAGDLVAGVDLAGAFDAVGSEDPLRLRALQFLVSTAAVFGFVVAFGAAAAALVVLAKVSVAAAGLAEAVAAVQGRLLAGGALVLPVAAFLFVAMYDDATLRWPGWPGGHPPLGDAWLFALLAYGVATVTLSSSAWPDPLATGGWVAAFAGAYLVLPVWLGWRCLAEESWVLGLLAGLTALLLAPATMLWYLGLVSPLRTVGTMATSLTLAVVGVGLPFGFARWSPGPAALARTVAGGLGRLVALVRSAGGRLRRAE